MHIKKRCVKVIYAMLLVAIACCLPTASALTKDIPVISDRIVLVGPETSGACAVTYPREDGELQAVAESLVAYVLSMVPDEELILSNSGEVVNAEYEIAILSPDPSLATAYALKLDGKRLTLQGRDLDATKDAAAYLKAFAVAEGCFAVDESLDFASEAGPRVLSQSPEKYYYYEDIYTPTLIYTFDEAAVDTARSRLFVGGRDVTDTAEWGAGFVVLSGYTVAPGDHVVLLALTDNEGAVKVFETTFSCGDGSIMHLYAGEVHSHTSDSDGQGTVAEAYAYARDVAGLDYFAVTDHSGYLAKNGVYQNTHISNADSFNEPGRFAALYGYEQTYSINTGYYGHLNTLNRSSLTTWEMDLQHYYALMAQDAEAVVQFNHPGYSWGNFVEYGHYTPELDDVINLIEVKGRSAAEYEYPLALSKGWHVSPVYNEDNHLADWGTVTESCGMVLAPALTRQNIIDAFRKNRTYTTSDPTLRVYYQVNGQWMGSRLDDPDSLHFTVQLSTENAAGLGVVSIIAEDGITIATKEIGKEKEYTLELDLPPLYDYYYVKVESEGAWCYTAPVWIENREQLAIDAMDHELVLSGKDRHRAYATLTNHTDRDMADVTVDFYLASRSGFSLQETKPLRTLKVGSLAPGETRTVSADVRFGKVSMPRIYAVAKGAQDGKEYGAVTYVENSLLYITEILPYTSYEDGFEFIELYNNSNTVLDLSRLSLRYYYRAGLKPSDLEEASWTLTGQIQPHSAMVLWRVNPENTRTVDDFNKYFGTDLVQDRDIVILTGKHLPHKKPVQLELCANATVLERIWYNWDGQEDVRKDRSIMYVYPNGFTSTATVKQSGMEPTPGVLTDGQVPKAIKP